MAVESATDRAAFVSDDDFGVTVTWTRSGTPSTFTAIFSRATRVLEDAESALIDRGAMLLGREADLPSGAAIDDPVAVAGESVTFLCRAIRPDGTGMVAVDLKKAS